MQESKMKQIRRLTSILLCVVLCLGLTACGILKSASLDDGNGLPDGGEHHEISEYFLELPYKDDFRVLQLSDIHLGNKDNRQLHYDFLSLTINDADADLIVIIGDTFTFADKTVAKELFAFLDGFGVPWTITFGNHDEQCYFSIDWLTDTLNNYGSNCVFKDIQGDDIFGNANFAINLTDDSDTVAQVILLDSNRYNFGDYWGYDYLKPSQISWYRELVDYSTQASGAVVPSIVMMHIPIPEFADAWEAAQAGDPDAVLEFGSLAENVCCPEYNTGFFDAVLGKESTKAIICGHDHTSNFRINYKGVYLVYGTNSTDRIYYSEESLGGMVITVDRGGELAFEQIHHSYSEVVQP